MARAGKRGGAGLGMALCADAELRGAVDSTGRILWGDQLMILLGKAVLAEVPHARFVGEVKCSQAMYDELAKAGGTCEIVPVKDLMADLTSLSRAAPAERMTVPVSSSVSVSVPNLIVASYTLGSVSRKGASLVARPRRSTRSPVANGSSVPRCPMLRSP